MLRRPQALEPVALAEIGAGRAVVAVAVHHQYERLLERRHEEDGGVRMVVRNVDDRRQRGGAEAAGEVAHQEMIEEYDIVLLRGVRAGQRQAEAQREAAQQERRERPAQQPQVPRRGYAVDIAEIDTQVLEAGGEGLLGNFFVFLTRLKRSSSSTSSGAPSLRKAMPLSWVLATIPSIRKARTPLS